MLVLFADTDMDLTPSVAREYGYHLISMPYTLNGETFYPFEDGRPVDHKAFYDTLRGGALPTTSAISPARYVQYFEPHFAAGDDILYVHFSAAMSATFDNMHVALRDLAEKYPERKLYEIDTKGITIISYNIACEIGEMYKAGKSVEEMLAWAEREVDHFALYFFAEDLRFFHRSGRVSGLSAFMGTLIGVRPIIYTNEEGKMVKVGTERGRQNAVAHLLRRVREQGRDLDRHRIVIGHTDAPEIADQIAEALRAEFGASLNIVSFPVNPTAGGHCGPGGVGVSFYASHR
ncbi:MAG: DegV family protein [Clostridia bacterium]|nr:DegV family protein [Clostridia bacterium]